MMADGLNRKASRLEAESSSASSVPATTMTAPRSASFRRQRLRTRRMTVDKLRDDGRSRPVRKPSWALLPQSTEDTPARRVSLQFHIHSRRLEIHGPRVSAGARWPAAHLGRMAAGVC